MTKIKKWLVVPTLVVLMIGVALPDSVLQRPALSAPDVQASPLSDAAYSLLVERAAADTTAFYVYQDADSGFNHGFPSGFFGADASDLARIHLNAACIDSSIATNGCSTDPNLLDRTHGNVLSVAFDSLPAGHFAGVNIEEPKSYVPASCNPDPNCKAYNLNGATNLVLDVRSPTPGGINVQFGMGGGVASFMHIAQGSTFSSVSIPLSSLGPAPNLAQAHILFSVVTNNTNAPNGGVVLLDNIRFEPVPTTQQSATTFPLGDQTFGVMPQPNHLMPIPPDQTLRNVTTTYESALTLQALLKRGTSQDLVGAQTIADAFVYALAHENHGDPLPVAPDGSTGLHNAYSSGDLKLLNANGADQTGDVRLSGFTSDCATGYCLVLDGANGGNNAFAILALAAAYKQFNNVAYLNAAKKMGLWITGNLTDTTGTGYGGYYFGYNDQGVPPPKPRIEGKSVENNADIFAAFAGLANLERGLGNVSEANLWTTRANIAGDFVMQMFDSTNGRFNAGTVPAGTPSNPSEGVTPDPLSARGNDVVNTFDFLDANTFTTLALAASPRYRNQINWRRPVQYISSHFAQTITAGAETFQGFDIVQTPTAGPNGIAWEFTAQAVVVMRFVDRLYHESNFASSATLYLNQIQHAQSVAPFGDGRGLVASTLQNGDTLLPVGQCLSTPFQCIAERVGLAATTWAIFADQSINPLTSIGLKTPGLHSPATSGFFLRNANVGGAADLTFGYGPAGSGWTPLTGDWDGDGTVTIGLFNPATSMFFLKNTNAAGAADLVFSYGPAGAGWIPVVGDWNGDGLDTVGLHQPGTSTFFLKNTNSAGPADLVFGYGPAGAGWTPLAGDWNGDGVDTVGLYNPSTSTFFLKNSNAGGAADLVFSYGPAGAGWTPLPGDWNSDGLDTAGLFDPATSTFFIKNTNAGGAADLTFSYGPAGAGWKPLAGDWTGQ
jgi:hypothetical protein